MTIEEFYNKKLLIIGEGSRFQKDFEYIFDKLTVVGRFKDLKEYETADVNVKDVDHILILERKDIADKIAKDLKITSNNKIMIGDDCFYMLDESLHIEHYSKGKPLAILGDGEKAGRIKELFGEEALPVRTGLNSVKAEEYDLNNIDVTKYFFVVATEEFEQGICILEDRGLEAVKDFIDGELFLMTPYSEMLRETIYAKGRDNVDCCLPFYNFIIDACMNPYPCCPSGVLNKWINRERLYYFKGKELWDSLWFKIYRLSMINKTYCFCDAHFCNRLNLDAPLTDKRADLKACNNPTTIQLEFDYTCNLHCPSCRSGIKVATPGRKHVLDKVVKDFKENGILDDLEWVRLAGYGDVFASNYYQQLLYSDKKRKNLFLITNGVLFTEDKFDRLVDCYEYIDIYISIDAATKQTYNRLRPGGDWEKLQDNLHMLSRKKKAGLIRKWRIQFVVQQDNFRELPEFIRMGRDLGVTDIYLNNIRNWGHFSEEEFAAKSILNNDYTIKAEVREVLNDPEIREAPKDFVVIDFMK